MKTKQIKYGFTLIELLIAVIIIGVLAAIIVPVLANRAADARETAAIKDLEAIAQAQAQVAIDIGYFVRLYVLDDTTGTDTIGTGPGDIIDGFQDEVAHQNAGNFDDIFINSTYDNPLASGRQEPDGRRIRDRILALKSWKGPYLNASRKAGWQAPDLILDPPYSWGVPVDPWGNPYILFTQFGRMEELQGIGAMEITPADKVFDRPTILSLGPDGLRGDGGATDYGTGDDLVRHF